MPGFYADGEYDLAGFIVGAVERERIITGKTVEVGDVILGLGLERPAHQRLFAGPQAALRSRQVHPGYLRERTQGQSRQRTAAHPQKLLAGDQAAGGWRVRLGHGPHHRRRHHRKSAARAARGVAAVIEMGSWQVPPIFEHLQQLGNVPQEEMLRTFNMGMGMLLVVPSKKFKKAQTVLERAGEKAFTVGRIVKGDRKVMYT